jgi:hypothetical protein
LRKNSAKTKESKQTFVGEAGNVCLAVNFQEDVCSPLRG